MPAQKRSLPDDFNANNEEEEEEEEEEGEGEEEEEEAAAASSPAENGRHHYHQKNSHLDPSSPADDSKQQQQEQEQEQDDNGEDYEGIQSPDDEDEPKEDSEDSESSSSEEEEDEDEKPEFVFVELPEIRKDVQCPICLGIIKKTRTVMECLHRFCRECIDKSMRLGNNECPACRTHCASRRSLRDDPNYDALIAALYPDIDKYEEEELAFHEEERTRNKQIQASIAQIFQRQTEALAKKRTVGKETVGPFITRSQRNYRTVPTRRRRNSQGTDFQGSEDVEEENDDNGGKDSSSADEHSTEVRQRRRKRRPGIRLSQPSSSNSNLEGGSTENDFEAGRENRGISPGLVWNTEMLAWGRGGTRSHTRHGNASGCNNKNTRSTRLSKLVEYLRSLEEKNDELDIHLMLFSLEKQTALSLQQPYLCCRPSLSVKHLCEYVARQTPLPAEDVEILLVKGAHKPDTNLSALHPPISVEELQILKGQETLAGLKADYAPSRDHLILAYRQKEAANQQYGC